MRTLRRLSVQSAHRCMKLIVVLAMALVPLLVSRAASAKAAPAVPSTFETRSVGVVRASYPPSARVRVGELLAELPRMQTALSKALSHPLGEPIDLRFVWLPEEMAALAPADSPPPRYATGVAYPAQRVAIVALADPRSGRDASARETLAHELAHVALAEATGDAPIPRWFHEGFAIQAAGERSLARYEVLAEAAAFRRLVPLDALDEHFSDESFDVTLAYAEAADVLRFLAHGGDHVRFVSLMERLRVGVDFERGLADAYGSDLRKLDYEWRTDAAKRFAFLPILTGGSVLWLGWRWSLALAGSASGVREMPRFSAGRTRNSGPKSSPKLRAGGSMPSGPTKPMRASLSSRSTQLLRRVRVLWWNTTAGGIRFIRMVHAEMPSGASR